MRKLACALIGCLGVAAASAPAGAAVLIPVIPVPNSSATTVFGINDSNTIAGSFIGQDDGIEHAFVGSLDRSEEHTSELQSRFGISYAVFCLKKKKTHP